MSFEKYKGNLNRLEAGGDNYCLERSLTEVRMPLVDVLLDVRIPTIAMIICRNSGDILANSMKSGLEIFEEFIFWVKLTQVI